MYVVLGMMGCVMKHIWLFIAIWFAFGFAALADEEADHQCFVQFEQPRVQLWAEFQTRMDSANAAMTNWKKADRDAKYKIEHFRFLLRQSKIGKATNADVEAARSGSALADQTWELAGQNRKLAEDSMIKLEQMHQTYCDQMTSARIANCTTFSALACQKILKKKQINAAWKSLNERAAFYQTPWRKADEYDVSNAKLDCRARYDGPFAAATKREEAAHQQTKIVWGELSSARKQTNEKIKQFRELRTAGKEQAAADLIGEIDAMWAAMAPKRTATLNTAEAQRQQAILLCSLTKKTTAQGCHYRENYRCKKDPNQMNWVPSSGLAYVRDQLDFAKSWQSDADKAPICEIGIEKEVQPLLAAQKQTIADIKKGRAKLAELHQSSVTKYGEYKSMRKIGNLFAAKELANKVDEIWVQAKEQQKDVLAIIAVGQSEGKQICKIYDAVAQDGCPSLADEQCLSTKGKAGLWREMWASPDMTTKRFAKTWRKKEDMDFTPNASAECMAQNLKLKGTIVFIKGRAVIERGLFTLPARLGSDLISGDIIYVEEASQVTIELMGAGQIKLTEKSKFLVPPTQNAIPQTGISAEINAALDRAWAFTKEMLKGECFEIKTPTAIAGVRG